MMRIKSSLLVVISFVAALTGCKSPGPAHAPAVATTTPATRRAAAAPAPGTMPSAMHAGAHAAPVLRLKFNSSSIDAIEAGTKTSTTRKGIREFSGNKVTAVDSSDADRTLDLEIVSAVPKKLADLTDADAKSDGSDSLDALKSALTTNYPGIAQDDMVTVITFKLAK